MAFDLDAILRGDTSGLSRVAPSGIPNGDGIDSSTDGSYRKQASLPMHVALNDAESKENLDYETGDKVKAEFQSAIDHERDPKKKAMLADAFSKDFGIKPKAADPSWVSGGASMKDRFIDAVDKRTAKKNGGGTFPETEFVTDNDLVRDQRNLRAQQSAERGIVGDTAKTIAAGAVGGVQTAADLGYAVTGAEPLKSISDSLGGVNEDITKSMSPEMQESAQKTFAGGETNDAWSDPRAYWYAIFNGVGSMIPMIPLGGAGGAVIKGAAGLSKMEPAIALAAKAASQTQAAAVASGVAKDVALEMSKVAGQKAFTAELSKAGIQSGKLLDDAVKHIGYANTAGFTGAGMVMTAGDAANGAMQETNAMSYDQLMKSPEFVSRVKANVAAGQGDDESMANAKDDVSRAAGREAAGLITVGALPANLVMGHVMGKLFHGGFGQSSRIGNVAVAAAESVPSEVYEEGATQAASNKGVQDFANPDKDVGEGVADMAIKGGFGALGMAAPHAIATPHPQKNSPLSNAAAAGAASAPVPPAGTPSAAQEGAAQSSSDSFGSPELDAKHAELGAFISKRENIAAMRNQDPGLPAQAFGIWGVINDESLPLKTRTAALEQAYTMAMTLPNFKLVDQEPEEFTRTAQEPVNHGAPAVVDTQQGGEVDFPGRVIDGEFSRDQEVNLPRTAIGNDAVVDSADVEPSSSAPDSLVPMLHQVSSHDQIVPEQAAEVSAKSDSSVLDAINQIHTNNAATRHGSIRQLVGQGFHTLTKNADGTHELSNKGDIKLDLKSPADVQVARAAIKNHIDAAAHAAASSPNNDLQAPTEAQIEAANYKKGHINLHGLDIAIENPQGSTRSGTDQSGTTWTSLLNHHYGYIKRTEGADGDAVDVFIGNRPDSHKVFVVDQKDPATGKFDEHKVMLGFTDQAAAEHGYKSNYDSEWQGMGAVTEMTVPEFKQWLKGDTKAPVADAVTGPAADAADSVSSVNDAAPASARDWIRPEIEALINQKRNARQMGKGANIERLIELSKKYMQGADVRPALIRLQAAPFAKDAEISAIAGRIHDRIRADKNKPSAATQADPAEAVTDSPEIQAVKAERTVQRQLFNIAANSDELVAAAAGSLEQFTETAKQFVAQAITSMEGEIASTSIDSMPNEFWPALYRRAKRLLDISSKEKNRDPAIYQEALAAALVAAGVELDSQPAMDAFKEGFDHALKGKSKSTLTSGLVSTKVDGYEQAWSWIRTEDGKAWYEGKRHKKLKNTGADLRRWFDSAKDALKDAPDSDPAKVMALIKKVTERAKVFSITLGDDATPGASVWADSLRGNMRTFGDWITTHGALEHLYGNAWRKGDDQKIMNFLNGSAYIHRPGEENTQDWTQEQRSDLVKTEAQTWLDKIRPLVDALSGASTVAELSDKLMAYSHTDQDVSGGYSSKLNDAGDELRWKLMVKRRLDYYLPDGSETQHIQSSENAEKKAGNRAKPLVPPRLDRITRTGLEDYRAGRDVTPEEFKSTFDFADVGFGRWVGGKQDQDHLNYAYDAFMDLSKLLGNDPKDIGFRGKLHFTIGALGHGKHAAHFAHGQQHPDGSTVEVINLTNTNGDGTVAHEWFHALDFYLGNGVMTNDRGVSKLVSALSSFYDYAKLNEVPFKFFEGGWRYKLGRNSTPFDQAVYAINYGSYGKPSKTQYMTDALELDGGKVNYWANNRELLARASEAWAFDTLGENKNNYLVNDWVGDGVVTKAAGYRGTMYPATEERKRYATYFDAFIKAIDWTAEGPKLDFKKFSNALPDERADFERAKKDLIERLPALWQEVKDKRQQSEIARLNQIDNTDSAAMQAQEDQRRRDEMRRQMEAESSVATADTPSTVVTDGPLTDDELEAIFDDAENELTEASQEQPGPVATGDNLSAVDGAASADIGITGEVSEQEQKSAASMAAEAAKLGVQGIDEALSGLVRLFGGGAGKLQSFPAGFDAETYAKAKPHFEKSLAAFVAAGKTLKELFKYLIQNFGAGIRPYAIQFAKDQALGAQLTKEVAQDAVPDEKQAGADDNAGDEGSSAADVSSTVGGGEPESGGTGQGGLGGGYVRDDLQSGVNADSVGEQSGELSGDGSATDNGGESGKLGGAATGDRVSAGVRGHNYLAPAGSLAREGSWRETASRNLDVIELVKKLEAEGRLATPDEQALLAKFTGWGASEIRNYLFVGQNSGGRVKLDQRWAREGWADLVQRASELFSQDEVDSAAQSSQYAHYTSERVIRSIWSGLERIGFTGGRTLEPGAGIGLFAVAAPKHVMEKSRYTGVEMDRMTAAIGQQLLQKENILSADFVKQKFPDGFFDLAIGNPPFSQTRIKDDPAYKKYGFLLHDYFFAKAIDKVRPGGLLVFVTSRGTMDKNGDKARQYLADRADLLGAIRLPQTAFKANAGADVVTDVLFLKKRLPGEERAGQGWMDLAEIATVEGQKHMVNEYFAAHPEMVLGSHSTTGSMYRSNEYTVLPFEGDIEAHFEKAVQNLPAGVYANAKRIDTAKAETIEQDFNPKAKKEGSIYLSDSGRLMRLENGVGVPLDSAMKVSAREEAWLKDYAGLRDTLKQAQYDQLNDGDWEASLKKLNKTYDAFVKKHGSIKEFTAYDRISKDDDGNEISTEYRRYKNNRVLLADVEGHLVEALESITEDGAIVKSSMLTIRSIKRPARPEINTLQDALMVSLDEQGKLNLDHIAELAKTTRADVITTFGDLIYEAPSGDWQMSDEYLSGDVLDKLDEAEQAAKTDARFERNVKALLLAQPKPLSAAQISVPIGANWVPESVVSRFASEVLRIFGDVTYNTLTNVWTVPGADGHGSRSNRSAANDWGTSDRSPQEILDDVLNARQIKVTKTIEDDGKKKTILDQAGTAAVNEMAKKMRQEFGRWVWTDASRAEQLAALYNRKFNNIAPRVFDGRHLTLPGLSLRYKLFDHQKRAIWRIIQTGNTYLAHAVGAGKTLEMIVSGMEQKRLGLINKPMYVVPNHMLEQFAAEFLDAYPMANLMVADEDNFGGDNRRRFVAQAALNAPDAIIITHSAFGLIKTEQATNDVVIDEIIVQLASAAEEEGDRRKRAKIEQQIENIKRKFDAKIDESKKDNQVSFEELGVDFLYIDEAHEFRKLDFATNRQQIKGIDPNGSQKALGLFIKMRWLNSQRPGRSGVLASGTPVTNTMAELFSVMRFMMPQELEKIGLDHFDAWANMFGVVASEYEMNAAGKYEVVERFSKFVNVPELMKRIRMTMDVLVSSQLGTLVVRPALLGGGPQNAVVNPSEAVIKYLREELSQRIEASRKWKPAPGEKGNPDPLINIITDGRLSAIDMRFVDKNAPNDPGSKLNVMIDNIIDRHNRYRENEYIDNITGKIDTVKGATQIIFSAVGLGEQVAKTRGFDAKAWIVKRLKEAGITDIAFMGDHNTAAKKEGLFKDMRSGRVSQLYGSPRNMGTGVNVQKRLKVLHYLSPPWFPADVEQPHGRIERQGNQNTEVEIMWYATKGTYDSTAWSMNARKARFIEQAFIGDDSVRSMEDVSEASQYEMASALAAGDERAIQLAGYKADIERLSRLKQAHASTQIELRHNKADLEFKLKFQGGREANLAEAVELVGGHIYGDNFFTEYNGTKIAKRSDIGESIIKNADAAIQMWKAKDDDHVESINIGTSQGKFPLIAKMCRAFASGEVNKRINAASLWVKIGAIDFPIEEYAQESFSESDPAGLAARLINVLNGVDRKHSEAQNMISSLNAELKQVMSKIGMPFPEERELNDKIAESAKLQEEMAKGGEDVPSDEALLSINDAALIEKAAAEDAELSRYRYRKVGDKVVAAAAIEDVDLPGIDGYKFFTAKEDDEFHVINNESGLFIGRGDTKTEAINAAKSNIETHGIDKVKSIISERLLTEEQKRVARKANPIPPSVLSRTFNVKPGNLSSGIDAVTADSALSSIFSALGFTPAFNAVETFEQLPEQVQADARAQGSDENSTKGAFHDGTMYIVLKNNHSVDDIEQTVFHEVVGHYGLRKLMRKDGGNLIQKTNALFAQLGGLRGLAEIAKSRDFDGDFAGYVSGAAKARLADPERFNESIIKLLLTEEVFAHIAEQKPTLIDKFKALIGAVREWARNHGFKFVSELGETDILHLLNKVRSNLTDPDGPSGGKKDDAPAMMRMDFDAIKSGAIQKGQDLLKTQRTFNSWWHTTVGTQYHKAQIDKHFGKVFDLSQGFIDDLARYANTAAEKAPNLLPKLESGIDAVRGLFTINRDSANAKAIADPIFQGTLNDKVFTEDELRNQFGLNDEQVTLFNEFRAAVDQSLDSLAISEMSRLARTEGIPMAPKGATLEEAATFYREHFESDLENAQNALAELKDNQTTERGLLEDAARSEAGGAEQRLRYADLLIAMNQRHAEELKMATDRLDNFMQLKEGITDKFDKISQLKKNGYAPLMRFGNYTVDVFEDDGTGKPFKNADGEEVRHFFGMFEDEADANAAARTFQEEYPNAKVTQGVLSEEASQLFRGVTPDTIELYARMAGENQSEAFQKYLKMAVNNRSAMKRLIHRVGVKGFSQDPARVLASFVTANARAAASNDYFGDMLNSIAEIPKEKGDVKDEAIKLMQYIQNPQEEASQLRGLLFINYLGGSVASALVNMTQPVLMTFPYLHQFSENAGKHLAWAMKVASKKLVGKDVHIEDKVLMSALHRAMEEGITSPHEVHMLYGESMRTGMNNNRWVRNLTKAWGGFFALAEGFNRNATFIAGFKIAEENGLGEEEAYEFAKKAVYDTQGIYSKANRPDWARGAIGATLFTFKQFSISYVEFLKRLPAKERAIALGILILASGLQGLPGADDWDDVIDTLAQSLGYNWNTKQEKNEFAAKLFGKDAAGYIMHGVSSGLPLDIAGRMSSGNLLPGTGILKKSEIDKTRDVKEFFGAAGGLADNFMTGFEKIQSGEYRGAAMAVAPKALSDVLKAYDMATTGKMHDAKGRVVADVTPVDAFIKGIGFNPTVIAESGRDRGILMQNASLLKKTQADIYERWAQGKAENDPTKIASAKAEMDRWNRNNPEAIIKPNIASIQRRANAMKTDTNTRFIKSMPKQLRQNAANELAQ